MIGLLLLRGDSAAEPVPERVIVVLRTESYQPASITSAVDSLQSNYSESGLQMTYRYRAVPAIAATVSADVSERLVGDPRVAAVIPDLEGHGGDSQSSTLVGLDQSRLLGFTGEGVTIGVIDSGVDAFHPDFAGAVVHEECFMAAPGLNSRCPNGETYQVGTGAAQDDLGHGTNVAGILSGRGVLAPLGVAPGASLAVYKVLDNTNRFFLSDMYAAIDDILADSQGIRVLNLSLGTFSENGPGSCTPDPFLDPLRNAGILVFASSMNQAHKNGIGYPACVSSVVSVGAVYDENLQSSSFPGCTDSPAIEDEVACWSNSDATLDLLAPGCVITSAGTGSSQSSYCGTSQASPHAAGGAALLLEQRFEASPGEVEARLKSTGVPRTDQANGVTTPRINLFAAVTQTVFGDVTCDFRVDGEDIAAVLAYTVTADGGAAGACPAVGTSAGERTVGDVTCEGLVDSLDALKLLLYYAHVTQPPGTPECPAVGEL
jgi:subtilisin family serine protease